MTARRLSVVVVSAGRPRALARCLTGLSQLCSPRVEVIVVADADGLHVARALPFADRLILLSQTEPNISRARNAGIAATSGEIVAFIDDDAVPEPTWADAMLHGFEDETVGAVTGLVLGRNGVSDQWGRMASDATGRDRWLVGGAGPEVGESLKLHGTNMAVRRSVLTRTGGFDPAFAFYLDETDLARRIADAGGDLVYRPDAVVHHGFAASPRRNEARVPLDLYDIGASTVVFLHKYAPASAMQENLAMLREDQRARLWRFAKKRKIDARQMRDLMESLEAGIADGHIRKSAHPEIPDPQASFRSLHTKALPKMAIWSGWIHQANRLRAEAQAQVSAGQPVTLLIFEPTPRKLKVEFTAGGWWEHRGGLYGPSRRSEPRFQLVSFRRRVRMETERIAAVRGIV